MPNRLSKLSGSSKSSYDMVIIGGGMVGSSFALALAKAIDSASILMIDTHEISKKKLPSFDDRSTALSFGSSQILSNSGVWEKLKKDANKIEKIQVSDKGHIGTTQLSSSDYDIDALGYVIENRVFGAVINDALESTSSIDYLAPASVTKLTPKADGMLVELEKENYRQTIEASLVVLADGGRSPLCSQLGINRDSVDYGQRALIANIQFQLPHQNQAFERFTDTGPLAVLPLASHDNENRASLVWTISNTQADEYASFDQSQLVSRLQERFGDRLGEIFKIGKLSSYPLSLVTAKEQIRPGLALLGNAAHTLHPVAGQGFNLALRDANALVASLILAREKGKSFGDMKVLQHYLDGQMKDQQQAILATDTLVRLFSNSSISKSLLRKCGLLSLELAPGFKQGFARQAMGLG
ncbi:MAG: 2-octaprenyl-6-methoxyphenyl hydroxylase, partial [Planktomarina sp.]|nr:2-octaprenyl-6-methoxyphenyl hydroxylase [Planktomarina sp.]